MISVSTLRAAAVLALGLMLMPGLPAAAAPAPEPSVVLEICRLPGLEAASPEQPIAVPAGTRFAPDPGGPSLLPALGGTPAPTPDGAVVTTEAVAISADGFCVDAKVRAAAKGGAAALQANLGRMFLASQAAASPAAADRYDAIYGLLKARTGS